MKDFADVLDARHAPEECGKACRAVVIPREAYLVHRLQVVGAQGIAAHPLLVLLHGALLLLTLGKWNTLPLDGDATLLLAVL